MTRVAHDKLNQMQQQMEDMQRKQSNPQPQKTPRHIDGDYIDYEEVK